MRLKAVWCVLVLALAAPAFAQVSPDRIAEIAKTVHDVEGWSLGSSSVRECDLRDSPKNCRNGFWARIIGIVHFGHPVYNPTPDPSWCLKDGGGGRPQTDDVATKCVSREFWDCIGGVGADGYQDKFSCNGHGSERLPAVQNVYAPPKPAGGGVSSGGGGTPSPAPPSTAPALDLKAVTDALNALAAKLDTLTVKVDAVAGVAVEARDAAKSAEFDSRELNAARMNQPPVPVLSVPCLTGRVPKPFGGSSEVTFCPKAQ